MQWMGGWHPHAAGLASPVRPLGGIRVSSGPVWSVGFPPAQVRQVRTQSTVLTVAGPCLATDAQLQIGVAAAAAGRYHELRLWPGSYLAVVEKPAETVVTGDLSGLLRVYHAETSGGYMWASVASPLAALNGGALNWGILLTDMVAAGYPRHLGQTVFHGVGAVPPGSLLRLTPGGASVEQWFRPPRESSFAEGCVQFREALLHGLARRAEVSEIWSSDLSGGVDSGSLTVLGSLIRQIWAITHIDPWLSPEDLKRAQAIADHDQLRIRRHIVDTSGDMLRFSGLNEIRDPPLTDQPSADVTCLAQFRACLGSAREVGSSLHLSGEGGDCVLTGSPSSILELWQSRQRREALRQATSLAQRNHFALAAVLSAMRQLAQTQYPDWLQTLAGKVESRRYQDSPTGVLSGCDTLKGATWLTTDAASQVAGQIRAFASSAAASRHGRPSGGDMRLDVELLTAHLATLALESAKLGVSLELPYLDAGVMLATLAVPGPLRSPSGRYKPLVTEGLDDLLPPVITRTTNKGNYGLSAFHGAHDNADYLRSLADNSRLVAEGLVEGHLVRQAIELLLHRVNSLDMSIQQFVAIEFWLAQLDLSFPHWWEEVT